MIVFDHIVQGSDATEENAIATAQGFDFSEIDTAENPAPSRNYNYIDTINGIEIYYDFCGDYYFFAPAEEN